MRDEGQRDPGDRHDPEDHPDVHDELEQDHRGEARREHRPEGIPRAPAVGEDPPDQQAEQQERDHRAEEPELLGQLGEDEVGRLDGEEPALGRRPVGQALAEQPPEPTEIWAW